MFSTIDAAVEHTLGLGLGSGGGGSHSGERLHVRGGGARTLICTHPMTQGDTEGRGIIFARGTAVAGTGAVPVTTFLPERFKEPFCQASGRCICARGSFRNRYG